MVPEKLTLHNFMSYRDAPPLLFSSFEIACLCGKNGSGKSTLLEAITFAIWNKARAGTDSLIHQGEQNMWVDLEFSHEGKRYRIIRKRSKKGQGTSQLDFLYEDNGWRSLTGATIKETEEKIAEVIKLPYEIFVNSSYLRQGHADEFSRKPPAERKKVLGQILGLEFYENLSQKAREKARLNLLQQDHLNQLILEIGENLKQKESFEAELKQSQKSLRETEHLLKTEEEKLAQIEKEKQKLDLLTQQAEQLDQQLQQVASAGKSYAAEIQSFSQEISKLQQLIAKKKEIEENFLQLQKLRQQNEQFNHKLALLADYKEELGILQEKEKELNLKIGKIQKISTCPTCLRVLTAQEAQKIINDLKKDFQKQTAHKLQTIKTKIARLHYDAKKHQQIQKEIKNKEVSEEEKKQLEIAESLLKEKQKSLRKAKDNLQQKREEYRQLLLQKNTLKRSQEKLQPLEEKYHQEKSKVTQLRQNLLEAKEIVGAFSQRLADLKKQEETYKAKQKQLQEIQQKAFLYKQLGEMFSKKGLQTMIIETILPEIEQEANLLLEKMTGGRLSISFITQKQTKTKEEERETLEIKVADYFGQRDYSLYSGGEAFRIDLAIRVALSKVLSQKAGTSLQFLVIDEGFGNLDNAGKDEVVQAIMTLKGEFQKILVVTHIEELKNLFDTRIEVEKDQGGSHFEIIRV